MDALRIGTFELHPSERMLCAAGVPVELGARAFDLLLVLVEHAGRLVTKNVLLDRVWPRLVVDENNLPTQIATLRRVLGSKAIHTVQGFGYRLELQVAELSSTAAPAASAPAAEPMAPPRRAWPKPMGSLVGRDEDLRALLTALEQSNLVSIVGAAGVGKTRLAQEVLAQFAQRSQPVGWVPLGSLQELQQVPSAIAVGLGLALPEGIDGFAALAQALESSSVLLILDCAERLNDTLAPALLELLSQTQHVRVLLTSQVPLGAPGEVVYRLAAFALPGRDASASDAAQSAAVAFFVQRATAADRRFALTSANTGVIADICRRLDGIPLALELAAARVPGLGVNELRARLDNRFQLLRQAVRVGDARHGTLHAALEWSYELLSSAEQRAFRSLGAFAGSFSLRAALACICDANCDEAGAIDLIGRLVDRSLISVLPGDPPRYALLETARYYALEQLQKHDETNAAGARVAQAALAELDRSYQDYWTLEESAWLQRYQADLDTVRAALAWALQHDGVMAVSLFGSMWPLFVECDLWSEGRGLYQQVLAHLMDVMPVGRIARFWEAIATLDATRQHDRARYAADLAASRHAQADDPRGRYYALMQLAANRRADTDEAQAAFETAKALENSVWPSRLLAYGALGEAETLINAGRLNQARAALERAVRLACTASDRQALALTVSILELDIVCGSYSAALGLGRPLAVSMRYLGRRDTRLELLVLLFSAELLSDEIDQAMATGAELYELAVNLDPGKLYSALDAMTYLACLRGNFELANRIAEFADQSHAEHGQSRRRPAQERMRVAALQRLAQPPAADASAVAPLQPAQWTAAGICAQMLGLTI